jgi:lycopene beta-cyclase
MHDVLVIGAGPAGLAIAAALCDAGLAVANLTPGAAPVLWPNTYGIWRDELEPLGLAHLLGHQWTEGVVYAGGRDLTLDRVYGLFDNAKLQSHLLAPCDGAGMTWLRGSAAAVAHQPRHSVVTTQNGDALSARIVVDASGHQPVLVQRPPFAQVAYQAAYGIVGTFSAPPVGSQQLVFMDYRNDHLSPAERSGPPTFLYAMALGHGEYFVEETSLAHCPALSFDLLEQRLSKRLAFMDVQVLEARHIERCLFPMNLPLPYLHQAVVGYGGAASMVHPASGFQVGAALKRAPTVAEAIVRALTASDSSPSRTARAAWQALWPPDRVRRRHLYGFGLENLLRFDAQHINAFFAAFFQLPPAQWAGYLSDTLSTREVLQTMASLFRQAPSEVRLALARSVGSEVGLLWRVVKG